MKPPLNPGRNQMKPMHISISAASAAAKALVKATLLSGVLMAFAPGIVLADPMEKKGRPT
jgi:hypothetical protein